MVKKKLLNASTFFLTFIIADNAFAQVSNLDNWGFGGSVIEIAWWESINPIILYILGILLLIFIGLIGFLVIRKRRQKKDTRIDFKADSNQIIELIKANPQIPYVEIKRQALEAGMTLEDFNNAWKLARDKRGLKIKYLLIAIVIIFASVGISNLIMRLPKSSSFESLQKKCEKHSLTHCPSYCTRVSIREEFFGDFSVICSLTEDYYHNLSKEDLRVAAASKIITPVERSPQELAAYMISELKKEFPDIETNPSALLGHVEDNLNYIKYIDNISEEVQLEVVQFGPFWIRSIKNPTEKVQLKVVKRAPKYIELIENPSEAVQLAALETDNSYNFRTRIIRFIKNPTEKVQIKAITDHPEDIELIENPTKAVKKLAEQLLAADNLNK